MARRSIFPPVQPSEGADTPRPPSLPARADDAGSFGRRLPAWFTPKRVRVLASVSLALAIATAVVLAFGGQVDIDVYLMGGAHVTSSNLYSLKLAHTNLYFTYPPFAAVIFAPLAHLPRAPARVVWALVNAVCLLWLLYVTIRAVRPELPRDRARLWAALLATPAIFLDPVVVSFDFGQVNVVIVALVMTDLALGTRLPKGTLTGIAAGIKLTPLIFIPYLFLTRQFRAGCTATGAFLACGAVGWAVTPHASRSFWTKDVFDSSRVGGLLSISNQNLKSALMRFAHGSVPNVVVLPLTAAVLVIGLTLALWAHRTSSATLGILVCATTGLIVSPVTWAHHLVWVVPLIVWLAFARDAPVHGERWALGVAIFFWARPIWWVPIADRGLHEKPWELLVGDAYFWAMLVFLAAVAALLTSRRRRRQLDAVMAGSPAA
jgi:alpha-1,2-mannosyltransferase